MRKVRVGKHVLDLYDAIDDMPIGRFHRFNRALLVDAGIGSDLTAVDGHIQKTVAFIKAGKVDLAAREMENLRQGVFLLQQGVDPSFSAFASLVAAVDGRSTEGWSESELDALVEDLGDVPVREVRSETGGVKKKIDGELGEYFPSLFGGAKGIEWYASLKRMALAALDEIDGLIGAAERLKAEEGRLLDMMAPRSFSGSGSIEIEYDREYENMCLAMTQQLHVDVKGMSVLEYYNAYEFLREQGKTMKQRHP